MASATAFYPAITAASDSTGLDWWLLYSVIEHGSGFDPDAEPEHGALGLMQLAPSDFPNWSPLDLLEPGVNVRLGTVRLSQCISVWALERHDEAVKLGLASYKTAPAFVLAAQYAAQQRGYDPYRWDMVEPLLKTDGDGVRDYVSAIWRRYAARRGAPLPLTRVGAAA